MWTGAGRLTGVVVRGAGYRPAVSEISHPDKVLWPSEGITKQHLADYYDAVADRLLPHLHDRPITLNHHPRGVEQPGFMRKDLPDHAPDSVGRWTTWAHTAKRDVAYALVDSPDALAWCAGQNVTEFHACLFRIDRPDRLDTLVVDLDPSPDSVDAATAALWIREVLDDVGLAAAVKTSGGRGLHVVVPVERRYDVDQLRLVVGHVARRATDEHPEELTTEFHRDRRGDRLFVDCTRVGIGATVIAAWSPRARSIPTVATPLDWSEVEAGLDPTRFTQASVRDRAEPADRPDPQRLEKLLSSIGA